jgi:hypothetical protein
MIDLRDEFSAACCGVDGDRLRTIFAVGVPQDALRPSPMFGMASIETHGTFYEPIGSGAPPALGAVIVPCGTWDWPEWQLVDLVAFKLDNPARWWRRLGIADVLGNACGFTVEPKTLVATPLDWLRIAGAGICLLDWSRDPVDLLMGAGALTAPEYLKNKLYAAAARRAVRDARNLFNDC